MRKRIARSAAVAALTLAVPAWPAAGPAPVCTAVPHDFSSDVRALAVAALGAWRVAPALEAAPRFRINVLYERADHELELESAGVGITYRF